MNILIIDGQGGRLGGQLVRSVSDRFPEAHIMAVGTNATAAAVMKKAGAHQAASGENPTVVACRKADVIIGPIGIVIADSLFGEVTPAMALAVGQADAIRILIPINKCENYIAGVQNLSLGALMEDVMETLDQVLRQKNFACIAAPFAE
ncbi:MAG: DUF3842 family protein [Oscillospiraceae bacterium]|nr:DUF3842 family protein [Oscillospiraceae bacterium]